MINAEKFWSKVDKKSPLECWEWKGEIATNGYGRFYVGGEGYKKVPATHASWNLAGGEVPKGYDLCHRCDNRSCVNPFHLFVGTRSENMLDADRKKRTTFHRYPERMPRGERHGSAKISDRDAIKIALSTLPTKVLAREYCVDPTTIRHCKVRYARLQQQAQERRP